MPFNVRRSCLVELLVKSPGDFYVLFMSSSSAHETAQSSICLASPTIITNKPYIDLKFTPCDVRKLAMLLSFHYEGLVDTLWALFKGHRLITVCALTAIERNVEKDPRKFASDFKQQTVAIRLRSFFSSSGKVKMTDCRAAIINSGFKTLHDAVFACNNVLWNGEVSEDAGFGTGIAPSISRGALRPVPSNDKMFTWSNGFVARWFASQMNTIRVLPKVLDTAPLSLVLLGFAWMNFLMSR